MDFLKDLSIDKVRNLAEDAFNQAKPKTDVEARVYEVLSHKNWGASSSLMNDIARDTFDYDKFAIISQIMWESMENQRPAAWRVVFKGLTLLEHLIKNGSERCVDDARNHGHTLRALHQFNYYEGTVDRGSGVREKSKQIVEILADDERIREERMKARKLREKFGGKLGGVSGGGGGGSGGRYAGYGNDNWNSGGGGAGGYGESGIGSGGRYDNDRGGGGGYSGRYDQDQDTRPTASSSSAPEPTFASIPDTTPKKTKKKKKKDQVASPAPAPAPEVDLFSFDAPAAGPVAAEPASEEFAAFQSASDSGGASDPFASAPAPAMFASPPAPAFASAPAPVAFDAFGSAPAVPQNNSAQFGAFGGIAQPTASQPTSFDAFGGSSQPQQDDDDFGDFAAAAPSKAAPAAVSSDPLSKLISLDGLSKNTGKKEDKLNQPIIANSAAATYVQEKDLIAQNVQQSKKGSATSFAGLDGLQKPSMTGMMQSSMSYASNPHVMGGAGGMSSIGTMFDPSAMTTPQQQGGGMMMMGMHPGGGGMPQMMPQQGMMGGMQGMQGGGMMNMTGGGMHQPGIQGGFGMQQPGMQGGMQGNFGMQQPGMQQGMQGNYGMQGNSNFGGQQMGGFR